MESSHVPRRFFGLLVFVAMLAALVPALAAAAPARAASPASTYLTVTPNQISAGSTVSIQGCFSGSGGGIANVYLQQEIGPGPLINLVPMNLTSNDCLGASGYTIPIGTASQNYYVVATFGTQTLYGLLTIGSGGSTPLTVLPNAIPANTPSSVTLSAGGYAPNEQLRMTVAPTNSPFNPVPGETIPNICCASNTVPQGSFSIGVTINPLPAGTYFVSVTGQTSGQISTGLLLVSTGVTPGPNLLTVSPSTNVYTGESLVVSGCFFTPGEQVKLYLSTTPTLAGVMTAYVATVTADSLGCIGGNLALPNFVVPSVVTAGGYFIVAVGQFSGTVAYVPVTVNLTSPTTGVLTLVPNPAAYGQQVTASGCGYDTPPTFASVEQVRITITPTGGGTSIYYTVATPTVTSSGCISVTFSAPTMGTYTVAVTGLLSGNTDTGSLTVTNGISCTIYFNNCPCPVYPYGNCQCPTYSLSNCVCPTNTTNCLCLYTTCPAPPSSLAATLTASTTNVVAGQTITLTGAYFTPGATVTFTGIGAGAGSQTTANGSGGFTVPLTVPAGTAIGNYSVVAQDSTGRTASVILYVTSGGASLTASAGSGTPGQVITVTGSGFQPGEQVTLSLGVPSTAPYAILSPNTVSIYTVGSNGAFTVSYTIPPLGAGNYVLIALGQTSRIMPVIPFTIYGVGTPNPPVAVPPVVQPSSPGTIPSANNAPLPSVDTGSTTTYFAEGYTGTAASNGKATFADRLDLFNEGTATTNVTITYYVLDPSSNTRSTVVKHVSLAPHATSSRSVNDDVGNDRQVSTVVHADHGVVAELVISRAAIDGTILDNASSTGTQSTDDAWYLAEGYTGESLQEYITLFNPGGDDAHAQVQYLPSDTPAPAAQSVTVPAHGQVTINVRSQYNGLVPQGSKNVATVVTSDNPIVVDRATYWGDGNGSGKFGYDFGPGQTSGSSDQFFAFLPTSNGSQSFVTVLNANDSSTNLTLKLYSGSGTLLKSVAATVSARQRHTFVVPSLLSGSGDVVGELVSSNPVAAEAGIYFGGSPNIGAHPGFVERGSTGGNVGARAEISSRGGALHVYNPTGSSIRVQVNVMSAQGTTVVWDGTLGAHAERTVSIGGGGNPRGVLVLSSDNVVAVLLSGGLPGQATAWGGNLD